MSTRIKVNLTIDASVLAEARDLGINMSRVADEAIERATRAERTRRWQEENAEAIRHYNEMIERDGIPLAEYRQF